MIIRRKPIHRRTVLKGMLGGAAVTVALPPLEAFLGTLPRRARMRALIQAGLAFFLGVMVYIHSIGFPMMSVLIGSQKNNCGPSKTCATSLL